MPRAAVGHLLLVAVVVGSVAAPSAQATTWSEPVRIAGPTLGSASMHASFTRTGRLYAMWSGGYTEPGCEFHCNAELQTYSATRSPAGSWAAPVEITGRYGFGGTAIGPDGNDGSLLLGAVGAREYEEPRAAGAVALHGSVSGAPIEISTDTTETYAIGELATDVGPSGDALSVWDEATALAPHYPVYAAHRRAGRRFGKPTLLGRPRAVYGIDAAVNAHGESVAVWNVGKRFEARAAANGSPFGRTVTFGGPAFTFEPVIDTNGTATVFLELRKGDRTRLVAYRWRGTGPLKRYPLDSWRARGTYAGLQAAGRSGETFAVWRSGPGDAAAVRTATFHRGGPVIRRIAGVRGSAPQSIDMLADGRAAVLVVDGRVIFRRAAGSLQVLGRAITPAQAERATVRLDPRSGRPTILFAADGPQGEGYSVYATDGMPQVSRIYGDGVLSCMLPIAGRRSAPCRARVGWALSTPIYDGRKRPVK